jgi:hypothetical protein
VLTGGQPYRRPEASAWGTAFERGGEIVEVDRPRLLRQVEHAVGGQETLVARLAPAGSGTDLEVEIDVELPGGVFGRIADALFVRPQVDRVARRSMTKLIALAEAKGPVPA